MSTRIIINIEYIPGDDKAIISINTRHNTIEYDQVLSIKELPEILETYIRHDM